MSTRASTVAIDIRELEFGWQDAPPWLAIRELAIGRGERVFVRGPSGSGKSTLLSLVAGVLTPRSGEVRVLGGSLPSMTSRERDRFRGEHLGFIFQMFNLIPYLSVIDNVLLPLRFAAQRAARAGRSAETEARRLLAALELGDDALARRVVTDLSIGQQQRVAAARALIGRPEIVIADEPTSALDADTRGSFIDLLMQECASHGTTLLFVSHDAALARHFDRELELHEINTASHAER